ncbi:MAG: hypothetical protein V4507_00380 [Verrucomicrobiota bacterium]
MRKRKSLLAEAGTESFRGKTRERFHFPGKTEINAGRQVMTVSVTNIVGFMDLSEQLTPRGMVNLLSRHFTLQSQAVQKILG